MRNRSRNIGGEFRSRPVIEVLSVTNRKAANKHENVTDAPLPHSNNNLCNLGSNDTRFALKRMKEII